MMLELKILLIIFLVAILLGAIDYFVIIGTKKMRQDDYYYQSDDKFQKALDELLNRYEEYIKRGFEERVEPIVDTAVYVRRLVDILGPTYKVGMTTKQMVIAAQIKAHPDRGGSAALFKEVTDLGHKLDILDNQGKIN